MQDSVINVSTWLRDNQHRFQPPICNHYMHMEGQLTVMYVGGPNERNDYHAQKGEELFLQEKGDMVLKVVERGRKKDIRIREGEIFLLPQRIPHSPQRFENTIGLVLERRRSQQEIDILRFFTASEDDEDLTVLYEKYFHWNDVKTEMVRCLNDFMKSEEYKTGKPTRQYSPPFEVNATSHVPPPFNLHRWMQDNAALIEKQGSLHIFDPILYKLKGLAYGQVSTSYENDKAETWFYQYKGRSELTVGDKKRTLEKGDSFLLRIGVSCQIEEKLGSQLLSFSQDP